MPLISIIIATYNSQRRIAGAIESILSSGFTDYELIIVNDGSDDKTEEIVQSFITPGGKIKLITQENSGPGGARNRGVKAAAGEYVLIIDDDDELSQNALSFYAEAAQGKPDIIISGYYMKRARAKTLFSSERLSLYTHRSFLAIIPDIISAHLGYITWNKLYKKSIIDEFDIKFTDYRSCEDRLFNLAFYKRVNKAEIIPDPLYVYHQHADGGLNNKFLENRKQSLDEFYRSVASLYDSPPGAYAEDIFAQAYIKGIYACIISTFGDGCDKSRRQKREYIKDAISGENVIHALKKARPSAGMLLPVLCLKSRSAALCTLCARLINFADAHVHSLFMKLKHNKQEIKNG